VYGWVGIKFTYIYTYTTSFNTNWVKGRIFCVGDRKGVKHSSWSTTVVARQRPGKMKTALWQTSLTASQAGENSQTNGLEHTIESSILTDLILRKNAE
jgi:hypothetical protein